MHFPEENPIVKDIYEKYKIDEIKCYQILTVTDSTSIQFIIVSDPSSTYPECDLRDILFEIFSKTEISKRFDKSNKFWDLIFTSQRSKKYLVYMKLKILMIWWSMLCYLGCKSKIIFWIFCHSLSVFSVFILILTIFFPRRYLIVPNDQSHFHHLHCHFRFHSLKELLVWFSLMFVISSKSVSYFMNSLYNPVLLFYLHLHFESSKSICCKDSSGKKRSISIVMFSVLVELLKAVI